MIHRRLSLLLGLVLPFLSVTAASAQLILVIDTDAETLMFTGSDTGAAAFVSDTYKVTFSNGGSAGFLEEGQNVNDALSTPFNDVLLYAASGGLVKLGMEQSGDPGSSVTLTGLGVMVSYSLFGSDQRAALEAMIGSSLTLTEGTGFSSVAVQAVPEPSGAVLMLAAAGLVGLRRRRR